ncbi:plasmid mobilization relaxosome protein MobC [Klebsiella pneumoniae]|nr:plasmid mobilization relaxosome protein MobC [Klebsiella pneumoniae]
MHCEKFSQWCEFSQRSLWKSERKIKIRLTETEHQRLLDRCDRTHLAEWLRQLGLGEHTSRKRRVPEVAPELLRQVSGIGNNLNQIARRLNQTDSLTPSERASLLVVLTSLDRQLGDLLEQNRDR